MPSKVSPSPPPAGESMQREAASASPPAAAAGPFDWCFCKGESCKAPIPDPPRIEDIPVGAKWVRSTQGKLVEYSVTGSKRPDAKVVVAAYIAMPEEYYPATKAVLDAYEALNIREIRASVPGAGWSEADPGHAIADWPKKCLAPILEAEGVDTFYVWGNSLGTQYALAIAQEFGPERVIRLGVRAPFVPWPLSDELKLGDGQPRFFPTSVQMANGSFKTWQWKKMWKSSMSYMKYGAEVIDPKLYKDYPELAEYSKKDMERAFFFGHYGVLGALLISAPDTTLAPGIDVRNLRHTGDRLIIWYGDDDTDVKPKHTKFLIDLLKPKEVRVFHGHGHEGACGIELEKFFEILVKDTPAEPGLSA